MSACWSLQGWSQLAQHTHQWKGGSCPRSRQNWQNLQAVPSAVPPLALRGAAKSTPSSTPAPLPGLAAACPNGRAAGVGPESGGAAAPGLASEPCGAAGAATLAGDGAAATGGAAYAGGGMGRCVMLPGAAGWSGAGTEREAAAKEALSTCGGAWAGAAFAATPGRLSLGAPTVAVVGCGASAE